MTDKYLLDAYGSSINAAAAVAFDEKYGEIDTPRSFHPGYKKIREKILVAARASWERGDNELEFQQAIREAAK